MKPRNVVRQVVLTALTSREEKLVPKAETFLMDWVSDGWGPLPPEIQAIDDKGAEPLTDAEKKVLVDWFYKNAPGNY